MPTLAFARLEDRLPTRPLRCDQKPQLAPLAYHGLPPRADCWQPTAATEPEGDASVGHTGTSYGDSSGYHQQELELAVATWAVVRMIGEQAVSRVRSQVSGWFPTVPRAELTALAWHLQSALAPATYVGDCKEVIRGARARVPEALTNSRSLHADLWRQVKQLIDGRCEGLCFVKTKAHRSRAEAERNQEDPIENWLGNDAADSYAKDLCRSLSNGDQRWARSCEMRARMLPWLCHIGVAAVWCFGHWPVAQRKKVKKSARAAPAADKKADKIPIERSRADAVAIRAHATHRLRATGSLV